jgi:glycosyltransferase involved in cell wall biosynthesis/SAM-dependent methyltransferase
LWLVGSTEGMGLYANQVRASIEARGLDQVACLVGKLSAAQLAACYRASDVLVCASEHEGFCVPLLEAMAFDLPVVAFSAAAVPETLGDAGILMGNKEPELWCETIEEFRTNDSFRSAVIKRQRERLDQFRIDVNATKLLHIADGLSSSPQSIGKVRPILQVQGPFETSYSLATINRNLALALDEEGTFDVSIYCTEGPGDYTPEENNLIDKPRARWLWQKSSMLTATPDVVIRDLYPPRVNDTPGKAKFLYFFWEDSLVAANWVADFNDSLTGIFVPSRYVERVLTDSGASIPLHLLHPGIDDFFFEPVRRATSSVTNKRFRFLHISSGFPRKGIDVLLEAFFYEFNASENVVLVIKTFPNIHNDTEEQISRWRVRTSSAPECLHISGDITRDELQELYRSANCLVHPTRAEGFGLPVAEAMSQNVPVIVTAYSGHMDFCNPDNAFLIDYEMAPSRSHFNVPGSKWAEPDVATLREQMRFVFENCDSELLKGKVKSAYQTISERFRWRLTAQHCAQVAMQTLRKQSASPICVSMVTSWDARCGIAEYSRYLIEGVQSQRAAIDFRVLSSPGEGIWRNSNVPHVDCWRQRPYSDLEQVRNYVLTNSADVIHFQFNFGFFELPDLAMTILQLKRAGKKVLLTFHSTADLQHDGRRISLSQIAEELLLADALLVHSKQDEERLASFGVRDNVRLVPHGNLVFPAESKWLRKDFGIPFQPVVGTFGFLLPHKGILELLEAIKILREEFPSIGFLAQCALHQDGISREFESLVRRRIEDLGLTSCVLLSTDFLSPEEAVLFLQLSDLIVLPYKRTQESSSASVRFALATGRPVITTDLGIFGDVSQATYQLESDEPKTLAAGIRRILCDDDLANTFARRALLHAYSNSWERVGKYYIDLLDAILSHKELPQYHASDSASCPAYDPRSLTRLNELTNPCKWQNPEWLTIHKELETYSVDKHVFTDDSDKVHRKGWEWTQTLFGLYTLGAIRRDAKALGVGAGHEPLLFYLADRLASVTGTDLYGNEQWSQVDGKEGDAAVFANPSKYCARTYDASKLQFVEMDGTRLQFPENSFDIVWSVSSIEHFGGHESSARAIREMARVAKRGGIVAVVTEFIIGSRQSRHPEFFNREDWETFILKASSELEMVEEMNYTPPSPVFLANPIRFGTEDIHRHSGHVVLDDGNVQWTSAIVFFRKKNF